MAPPEDPGHLLTTSQVAKRFQVDAESVRKWVRQGKVPAIKLSGKYNRFRPEDIERIVAEGVPDKAYDQIADVLIAKPVDSEKPSEEGSPTPRQETLGAYPDHEAYMYGLAWRIRWLERHRHWWLRTEDGRHQREFIQRRDAA